MSQAWFLLALTFVSQGSLTVVVAHGAVPLATLALMLAGCSGAKMSDSGPDATPSGLSAGDSSDVALPELTPSVADSSIDASEANPPVCTHTLEEGCTPNPPFLFANGSSVDFSNCPPTWNDAIAVCVTYAGDFGYQQTDCGAYRRWHVENVDVGCSYYYDATSGDLASVFCTDSCLGGPPGSTEPPCAALELQDYRPCVLGDEMGDGGDEGDAANAH